MGLIEDIGAGPVGLNTAIFIALQSLRNDAS